MHARLGGLTEKTWNAIIQVSNVLVLELMRRLPSSCRDCRRILRELKARLPEIRKPNAKG